MSGDSKHEPLHSLPARLGDYYDAVVPDTLDLAERARLGIHHFVSITDESLGYEMAWTGTTTSLSPSMAGFAICQPKALEALAMLRVMSGSQQDLEREARMVEMMASLQQEDGLYWIPRTQGRKPWLGPEENRPYCHLAWVARMLYAGVQWYQYTGNALWKERMDRLVDACDRLIVTHKDDYAYVPTHGWIEEEYFRSCYTQRGWKDTSEPPDEKSGEEGSLFNHQGNMPGPLSTWYLLTGNEQALRLAGELVRFLTKPQFWADWKGGEYLGVVGAEHAHWHGHVHGYINTLRAILEYAIAANDARLKAFVRDGYEWTRQPTLARYGFVGDGQGCGCGRLIGLAVKLTCAGVGDYWEDVDLYVRNIHAEMQYTPEDFPERGNGEEAQPASGEVSPREAMIGGFAVNVLKKDWSMPWALCCSPHGNMGLFYAWDGTLRYSEGVAQVNLLLNRASPWMDVDSYLPYEGKVVLRNKTCREAFVRIPLWVEKDTVACRIGERAVHAGWLGRHLRLEHLEEGDVVTIDFPVSEWTEQLTGPSSEGWDEPTLEKWSWAPHAAAEAPTTFRLRGNTIVGISQPILPGSPVFLSRTHKYRDARAPMTKVERFATPMVLKW